MTLLCKLRTECKEENDSNFRQSGKFQDVWTPSFYSSYYRIIHKKIISGISFQILFLYLETIDCYVATLETYALNAANGVAYLSFLWEPIGLKAIYDVCILFDNDMPKTCVEP